MKMAHVKWPIMETFVTVGKTVLIQLRLVARGRMVRIVAVIILTMDIAETSRMVLNPVGTIPSVKVTVGRGPTLDHVSQNVLMAKVIVYEMPSVNLDIATVDGVTSTVISRLVIANNKKELPYGESNPDLLGENEVS